MIRRKKGFTLIESLLALSIAGGVAGVMISSESEHNNNESGQLLIEEINEIINAVDHRIAIDGYDPLLWGSKLEWSTESEIAKLLIKEQLNSEDSNCSGGKWKPSLNTEKETNIIKCGLWEKRRGIEGDISAKMNVDSIGFIQNFELMFSFNKQKEFNDYFQGLKKGMQQFDIKGKREISGDHTIELVKTSNPNSIMSVKQCISDPLNCSIKASFNRSGGNEYIRADGQNSMIGEHFTFIESKTSASPMKCLRWTKSDRNGSNDWGVSPIETDCGIGIYKNGTDPIIVDTVSDTGTFKNVVLDRECHVFSWNGTTVSDSGDKSPCGMIRDDNSTTGTKEVIQVVTTSMANTGIFNEVQAKELNAENINIQVANIDNLVAKTINAEIIKVSNELNIDGIAEFNDIVNFNTTSVVNFYGETNFFEDVDFNKHVNVDSLTVNNETTIKGDLIVEGSIKTDSGDLDDRLNQIENELNTAKNDISTNKNNININKNGVNKNKNDISSLANRVTKNERDIANLKNSVNSLLPPPAPKYKWKSYSSSCGSNRFGGPKVTPGGSCSTKGITGYTSQSKGCGGHKDSDKKTSYTGYVCG